MFDEISDHGVPDDKISFGAGGDGKGIYIYICKARNNRCAYNGQCLTWKGIGDPQGL